MPTTLTTELVHALSSIGGRDNPPARLIVGWEGIASVKEKLKTVSEELEDFVEISESVDVDVPGSGGGADGPRRGGGRGGRGRRGEERSGSREGGGGEDEGMGDEEDEEEDGDEDGD
jgi:hypothetical protein